MRLFAFPCKKELADFLCDRVDVSGSAALILRKQESSLRASLEARGVRKIFVLPEEFYGRISSAATREVLEQAYRENFDEACLPLNDFLGNIVPMLRLLAPHVTAVSATSAQSVELRLPDRDLSWDASVPVEGRKAAEVQDRIVRRLSSWRERMEAMAQGSHSGERPTQGLLQNFPYDCEVLSRYAHAAAQAKGHVVEIGCGLGYGAYLMAELNPELRIRALDHDPSAITLARELWGDNPRLSFEVAVGEKLPCGDAEFDGAVCFEVVEHVEDPRSLFREIGRVLSAGGRLIGSTPNSRLYPYRVYRGESGTPEQLRQAGVWFWHVQEFDERSLGCALEDAGFAEPTFGYPTFISGMEMVNRIRRGTFAEGAKALESLRWSVADFAVLDSFCPGFSGYSFVFSSHRN